MKTMYIIFRDKKPKDNKEMFDLITHFCGEHNLSFQKILGSERPSINIEGQEYHVELQEMQEEPGRTYWMILCLLKNRMSIFKNIA